MEQPMPAISAPLNQLAYLRSMLSPEIRNILNSIGVNPTSDLTLDQILDKIQAHLRFKRSVLADRFAFLDAYQHTHETVDDFLARGKSNGNCL